MKRFRFTLERLERVRDVRRMRARGELARAVARARRWSETIDSERRLALRPVSLDAADACVDAETARGEAEWRVARRRLARHAADRELEARDDVVQRRQVHAETARDHRVVERLREKRFERWRLDAEREELGFLDEVHLLRVLRDRRARDDDTAEEDDR